jgi:hypothetical protein
MNARMRIAGMILGALFCVALAPAIPARAADEEKPAATGKNAKLMVSGVGWVTYRYQLSYADLAKTHYIPVSVAGKDRNSFDIDRVYLTADYTFNDRYSWQTVVEMNNLAGASEIFLKRAYLKIRQPFGLGGTALNFGQIPHVFTPLAEDVWGYRIVARVPLDRYLGVSTTWVGAGCEGKVVGGVLDFNASVTNENAYNKLSSTKYKSLQAMFMLTPAPNGGGLKGLHVAFFAQANPKMPPGTQAAADASRNQNIWWGVLPHFRSERFTIGAEYDQKQNKTAGASTVTSRYLGGYGWVDLSSALPQTKLFARFDRYDPNTDSQFPDDGSISFMGGFSHSYTKGVRSLLDLEYTQFDKKATKVPPLEFPSGQDKDVTLSARMEISL